MESWFLDLERPLLDDLERSLLLDLSTDLERLLDPECSLDPDLFLFSLLLPEPDLLLGLDGDLETDEGIVNLLTENREKNIK